MFEMRINAPEKRNQPLNPKTGMTLSQTHSFPSINYLSRQQSSSNMSPGTMAGSTFAYDDDVSFMELNDDFCERDDILNDAWPLKDDLDLGDFSFDIKKRDCVTPVRMDFDYNWKAASNTTHVDFTPFLEKLDSSPDTQYLARNMMQLIARYFHEKITIFKDDVKIFNALDDQIDIQQIAALDEPVGENNMNFRHRVMCNLELDENVSPEVVRNFLGDADDLLGTRDDLKLALRSALPPTMVASGFGHPIFSSPLARKKRRAAQNSTMSAAIAALYRNDEFDFDDARSKLKKRGRPRKGTMGVESEAQFSKLHPSSMKQYQVENEGMITRQSTGTIVPSTMLENKALLNAPKLAVEVATVSSIGNAEKLKQLRKKKEIGVDDEWKPEKKRTKTSRKESSADNKKLNKIKSPTDKVKEEAELLEMGIENLEKHIITLQHQMRNVKHKHRKGTICPRCTTEQRLKLSLKVRNKAHLEIRSKPVVEKPTNPEPIQVKPEPSVVTEAADNHVEKVETKEEPRNEESEPSKPVDES